MAEVLAVAATLVVAAAIAMLSTGRILPWLKRRQVIDYPNDRSSHAVPTPRGGGLGMLIVIVPALWTASIYDTSSPWRLCALSAAGVAWCSWVEDRRGVAPLARLSVQTIAVVIVIGHLDRQVIEGIPFWLDRCVIVLGWLWFLNLYNFMDGIDGLAATEAVSVALGATMLGIMGATPHLPSYSTAAIAGASLGFLRWNWSPARVFMGDVGSVPLGFTLGFILIIIAADGCWPAALVLPAYFVVDATTTLFARVFAGKRPWEAHRDHFYQRAVASGRSHSRVTSDVGATNLVLVGLAVSTIWLGWWPVPVAALALLRLFARWRDAV